MPETIEIDVGLDHRRLWDDRVAVNRLLPQLTKNAVRLESTEDLEKIAVTTKMFFARIVSWNASGKRIILGTPGMSGSSAIDTLRGRYLKVNDVVVDVAHRGKGIAVRLITAMIDYGVAQGFGHIDLTSNPERVEANHLYRDKLGFRLSPHELFVHVAPDNFPELAQTIENRSPFMRIAEARADTEDTEDVRAFLAARFPGEPEFRRRDAERILENGAIFIASSCAPDGSAKRVMGIGCATRKIIPTGCVGLVSDVSACPGGDAIIELALAVRAAHWAIVRGCRRIMLRAEIGQFDPAAIGSYGFTPADTNYYTRSLAPLPVA